MYAFLKYLLLQMLQQQKIRAKIPFFIFFLLTANGTITVSTDYTAASGYCSGSPYWNLNQCNITCATCVSSDQTLCLTCDSNFTLSSVYCKLTNDSYTYILQQYFTTAVVSSSDLTLWTNSAINKKLTTANTVSVCYTSSYNFGMIGLFGKDDKLNLQLTYTNQMSYMTLKFNLLLLVNYATLQIDLGQKSIYNKAYSNLSNLDATYYTSTNDSVSNILYIPSLSSSNVGTVIQVVNFDTTLSTKEINLYFTLSAASSTSFWAISDVSVLLRQCDTCPTTQLMTTIKSLGYINLYTTAFTVPLIFIFWVTLRLKQYFQKKTFQQRKGGKILPNKAINRVCESIKGKQKVNSAKKEGEESKVLPLYSKEGSQRRLSSKTYLRNIKEL